MTKRQSKNCELCGKTGVRQRRISRTYGSGKKLLLIENVPVITCPHCGESYLTADTLHEIHRLRLLRKGLAKSRNVDVLNFA
jgi:YgiT-type zinc finger domain-containing protein